MSSKAPSPARRHATVPPTLVHQLNELAAAGRGAEAAELSLWAVSLAVEVGSVALLADTLQVATPYARRLSDRAWLENYRAILAELDGDGAAATRHSSRALQLAKRSGDRAVEVAALTNAGVRRHRSGRDDQARSYYIRALPIAKAVGDHEAAAKLALNLASVATHGGALELANRYLRQARGELTQVRHPGLRASYDHAVAEIALAEHDLRKAGVYLRRAIRGARGSGRHLLAATSMQNLGTALLEQGRTGLARQWLAKAIDLAEGLGAADVLMAAHRSSATANLRDSRYSHVEHHLKQVRLLADRLGDSQQWAGATLDLAALAQSRGNMAHARRLAEDGLNRQAVASSSQLTSEFLRILVRSASTLRRGLGVWRLTDRVLSSDITSDSLVSLTVEVSEILLAAGRPDADVLQFVQRAFARLQGTPSAKGRLAAQTGVRFRDARKFTASEELLQRAAVEYEAAALSDLALNARNDRAIVLGYLKQTGDAMAELEACVKEARRRNNRAALDLVVPNLAEFHRRDGDPHTALRLLEPPLRRARDSRNLTTEAWLLNLRARALADLERFGDAEAGYTSALSIAQEAADLGAEAHATGGLAWLAYINGNYEQAANLYDHAAKLNPRNDYEDLIHLHEDLEGSLASYARTRFTGRLSRAANALVKASQEHHFEASASDALFSAGQALVDTGRGADGAMLLAASVALLGTADRAEASQLIATGLARLATYVRGLETDQRRNRIRKRIIKAFDRLSPGLGDTIQPLFESVYARLEETDGTGVETMPTKP